MNVHAHDQQRLREIFCAVRQQATDHEKSRLLDERCLGNASLRKQVEQLLAAASSASPVDRIGAMLSPTALEVDSVPGERPLVDIANHPLIGPYKLLEQIGEGGMGTVFHAQQSKPIQRRVALKIIKLGMDTGQVVARFEAERQALALMDHPNIAKVLDAGATEQGRPYFVMELVKGIPITDYCSREKLDTDQRLKLFIDVCHGVQHAHQKGIIHRDLKPSNILITLHDGKPVVKIIDFGIAKAIDQELTERTLFTQISQMIGTPLYMSPEQAEVSGLDIDTRSDVYSLGVLLYELLTGTTPFDRESMKKVGIDEIRRMIRETEPPRPSQRFSTLKAGALATSGNTQSRDLKRSQLELQGELDWIVMKALEKERNRRYESASAFANDVQRFLDDEPVQACPPSLSYRLSKSIRKHRTVVITISLAMVGLLAAVAGTSWQALRATRAEQESDERLAKLSIEQRKTSDALLAAELAEEEQRRMRIEAEDSALREQEVAKQQSDLRLQAERSEREAQWNVYVAKLNPMQYSLESGDFGRVDTLLKQSVPAEDEPDFRGWEWYYLRERVDSTFMELAIEANEVSGPLAWNPVANEFATFSAPHFIDVWNADTLKPIRRLDCHETLLEMEWSPHGNMIAVGTAGDSELIVLDASVGTTLWRSTPHSKPNAPQNSPVIIALSWNCDNNRIAVGNRYGEIAIVDLDAKTTSTLRKPEQEELLGDLDWHPDGNRLAAGLRFGKRTILDVRDKSVIPLDTILGLSVGEVLCWSPGGSRLATSEGRSIRIADESGKIICELTGHTGVVERLCWINETSLVSAARDQTIRTWDIKENTEVRRFKIHDAPVTHLALSSRDAFLSAGGGRVHLSRLSMRQRETVSRIMTGDASETSAFATNPSNDKNSIQELKWSPNGKRICAVGEISHGGTVGGSCGVWSSASSRSINAYQTNLCKGITWSSDGTQLLRAAVGDRIQADDFRTGIPVQSIECRFFDDPIAFWSPSTRFVTTHGPAAGFVRDARNLQPICDWSGYEVDSRAVAWSPSENHYISGGYGHPMLFSMDGNARAFPDQFSRGSFGVAWHPSEKVIALGNGTGNIVVRDRATLEVLSVLKGHTSDVMDLDFSPDGRRLASASYDGTVRIWDFATGAELMQITAEGVTGFGQVEWSPDGLQLAAGTTLREVVIFGSNELAPTPDSAAEMETGAVLQAYQNKTGVPLEWHKAVPKLAWRDPLVVLQRCAGGLDGSVEMMRFEAESADFIAASSGSPAEFESLMQAWLVLIEAHNDPGSAVALADRMLQTLNEDNLASDKERSLVLQLEALILAGQRTTDLNDPPRATDYFATAEQLCQRLTTDFPTQGTYWRHRLSIAVLQSNALLQYYKQLLLSTDQGTETITTTQDMLQKCRVQLASLYSNVPEAAFFLQPTGEETRQYQSWTAAVSEAELQHGIIPTFMEDWTSQFATAIENESTNHYPYYQLALCRLLAADSAAYSAVCQSMLERFSTSNDPNAVEFSSWTAALAPNAVDDYEKVLQLARNSEHIGKSPTYHLGALLYRAGELDSARDKLLEFAEVENEAFSPAYVWYFLAMTEHQLGNEEQAKSWLVRASDFTTQLLADEKAGKQSVAWNRRATLRLLDAEARIMLAPVNP